MIARLLCARAALSVVSLLAATTTALGANTPPGTLSGKEKEHAVELVRRLGDRSFKVREAAGEELVQMGRVVEPVLRDGMMYPDAEVRQRCKRLLPLALSYDLEKHIRAFLADKDDKSPQLLAGWPRFKEIAGGDHGARLFFASLHRYDAAFMDSLARDPASLKETYRVRCQEFMTGFNYAWGRITLPPEQIALLLLASFEPRVGADMQTQMFLSNGLNNFSYQPNGKSTVKDHAPVRKLIVKYISEANQNWAANNLMVLANLDLREEGLQIARQQIADPKRAPGNAYARSMAISLIGKLGAKEDMASLVPFLEDKTVVGGVGFNNKTINTQLRDVTLANLAKLSGHNLRDYNFAYLQQFPQNVQMDIHSSPQIWGFTDEATRTASIKKWKDWWDKDGKNQK